MVECCANMRLYSFVASATVCRICHCQLSLPRLLASLKSCSGKIYPVFNHGWPHRIVCCYDFLRIYSGLQCITVFSCVWHFKSSWHIFSSVLCCNPVWGRWFYYPHGRPIVCFSLLVVTNLSAQYSGCLSDRSLPTLTIVWVMPLSLVNLLSSGDRVVGLTCQLLVMDWASEEQNP